MKPYDTYKDSGIEWIGEIPSHWNSVMIKRLSAVKRGASPRPIDDSKYFDEKGEYAWVRIADVSASERYLINTTQTLSELGASLSVKREPGDFFLSIAGTVGKPIITKIKCCIHDGFVYFPDLKMNPEYLYYIFSTNLPYQGLGKWGTQLNLNTDTVGEIVIPIPKEIESIITYLDLKTAEIDALIADKKHLLELYEEEKTAIINQAVTKGIDPKAKMKDSGIDWLGEIPEHWEVKKLRYIKAPIKNSFVDGPFGSNLKTEHFIENGDIYVIDSGFITSGNFEFNREFKTITYEHFETVNRSECREADIIIAKIGANFGMSGILPKLDKRSLVSGNTLKLTADTKYFDTKFIHKQLLCLKWAGEIDLLVKGSAQPALSMGPMLELSFAIPDTLKEQQSIVCHIETECTRIDAKIAKTQKLIELLTEYRTALISEVVTGKIKVMD